MGHGCVVACLSCISFFFFLLFPTLEAISFNIVCTIIVHRLLIFKIDQITDSEGVINLNDSGAYFCWRTENKTVAEGKVIHACLLFDMLIIEIQNGQGSQHVLFVKSSMTTQSWSRLCRISLNRVT